MAHSLGISHCVLLTNDYVMLRLALPQVNVLSKIDLLGYLDRLPFNLEFFTDLMDISPLAQYIGETVPQDDEHEIEYVADSEMDVACSSHVGGSKGRSEIKAKFKEMSSLLCEIVNDYGLVSFVPLNISDGETVHRVLSSVDQANGYSMASFEAQNLKGDSILIQYCFL